MGFVKTAEEIARIQAVLHEPRFFSSQMLSVQYLTKREIVKHVLPPGLEPTDSPLVTVMVGRWGRSNCVHAFAGGGLYVQAQHGQHVVEDRSADDAAQQGVADRTRAVHLAAGGGAAREPEGGAHQSGRVHAVHADGRRRVGWPAEEGRAHLARTY